MNLETAYTLDIESSGLLEDMVDHTSFPYKLKESAKLWCVVITNVATRQSVSAVGEEITQEWLREALKDCKCLIAHHGLKFDFPALRLFGVLDYEVAYPNQRYSKIFGKDILIVDTHILSRLFNPDRVGGHSLEVWGARLGHPKIDWRAEAIGLGLIEPSSPKGSEFSQYHPKMLDYCVQDTIVNVEVFLELIKDIEQYAGWSAAIRLESKLADLAINRETLGFWFDKDLAEKCVNELEDKLKELYGRVTPLLPPRPMTKGELDRYTPPKRQLTTKGEPTRYMKDFAERLGLKLWSLGGDWFLDTDILPLEDKPVLNTLPATIDDGDWVKMHLISLGWEPTEWKERDLTKDSKKQTISIEKREAAVKRYCEETLAGKYKDQRLSILELNENTLEANLLRRVQKDSPVRVPTAPTIKVGLEKDLCPNLVSLGEKVDFAKDFAAYTTYKHRKSSIAGGEVDEEGSPETGYLSMYREEDGRVATPAIEIGASTNRYRHIGVANIPRASSIYGKEMRSLFGCGPGFFQLGYDFSSLEGRIEGHYCYPYDFGEEYAETLIAEKPNDIHSVNAKKLDIARDAAKSIKYGITYGAQAPKIAKMLGESVDTGQRLFDDFWVAAPALKDLKTDVERSWVQSGKKFVLGVDGRKIVTRSQHSLLNALFQSAGVIAAKYTTVYSMQSLEEAGYCISPFKGKPDVCSMIEYHDEAQLIVNPDLVSFKTFDSKEEAKEFVSGWSGEQLSSVSEGSRWYVALPNPVSTAIDEAIKKTTEELKLNVPLGFEWVVNKNWYGCH